MDGERFLEEVFPEWTCHADAVPYATGLRGRFEFHAGVVYVSVMGSYWSEIEREDAISEVRYFLLTTAPYNGAKEIRVYWAREGCDRIGMVRW